MLVEILPTITMQGPSPSMGSLLGTAASDDVLQQINSRHGMTFFGNRWNAQNDPFMQAIVAPIRQSVQTLQHVAGAFADVDRITPLTAMEHFQYVPPAMHLPILLYPPVRSLLERGRIDGFGYDPDTLPDEDVFGRLINNGTVESVEDAYKPDSDLVTFTWDMHGDDPELSLEERDHIQDTRDFILHLLNTTDRDPTDIDQMRG